MQCADCGVPLVDTLDSAPANPAVEDEPLVAMWAGNDAGECNAVKGALEKAGIPFTDKASSMNFIFPSMGNKYEVWVPSQNQEKAREVLLDLDGRLDPAGLTAEEIESLALPISDDSDHDHGVTTPDDIPEEWDDEAAGAEVWSGDQEDFADTLAACLRENGIPSQRLAEENRWHLVVRPEQEARAREIVREVVEAAPPD
jgi:hypothetical protein